MSAFRWTVGALRTLARAWLDRCWWRRRRARLNRDGRLVIDGLLDAEMKRDLMARLVQREDLTQPLGHPMSAAEARALPGAGAVREFPPTVRPYLVFQPVDLAAMRAVEGW